MATDQSIRQRLYLFLTFTQQVYTHLHICILHYIFLSQRDLPLMQAAKIGIKTFYDHAPVSLSLRKPNKRTGTFNWRLNPSLLTNASDVGKISEGNKRYFAENDSDELSPLTIWAAHKCVIRGGIHQDGCGEKERCRKGNYRFNTSHRRLRGETQTILSDRNGCGSTRALKKFAFHLESQGTEDPLC